MDKWSKQVMFSYLSDNEKNVNVHVFVCLNVKSNKRLKPFQRNFSHMVIGAKSPFVNEPNRLNCLKIAAIVNI